MEQMPQLLVTLLLSTVVAQPQGPVAVRITLANHEAKARAKAATLGGLVADAATTPLHWLYDTAAMDGLLQGSKPEFFSFPSCPFYYAECGEPSPYGDELYAVLRTAAQTGGLDPMIYSERLFSHYQKYRGFRSQSVKAFLSAYGAGQRGVACGDPHDFQANCFIKVPVVVALYVGTGHVANAAAAAIRVQQNNITAEHFGVAAALILEQVVLGRSIIQAMEWALHSPAIAPGPKAAIKTGLANRGRCFRDVVSTVGQSCANPNAFANVVTCVTTFPDYVTAVRHNILAGGDNCSRSCLIGALFAAQGGMDVIPMAWRCKTRHFSEYQELVAKL